MTYVYVVMSAAFDGDNGEIRNAVKVFRNRDRAEVYADEMNRARTNSYSIGIGTYSVTYEVDEVPVDWEI